MKRTISVFLVCFIMAGLLYANGINDLRVISSSAGEYITVAFKTDKVLKHNDVIKVKIKQPGIWKRLRYNGPGWEKVGDEYFIKLPLQRRRLWNPDNPRLYDLFISIKKCR